MREERIESFIRPILTLLAILVALKLVSSVMGLVEPPRPTRLEARTESSAAPTPTATPVSTKTPNQYKLEAEYLDPRRLAADPEGLIGQNIYLQGKAFGVEQFDDFTWVNLQAGVRERSIEESIVVELRPRDLDVLREECYRFFGIIAGTTSTRIVLTGAENESPLVKAYAVELSTREGTSGCAAP